MRDLKTLGIFGLYHLCASNLHLVEIEHPKILKIYSKITDQIWFTEPYEYSFK